MPLDRPPVDGDGVTLPHDHAGLDPSDIVIRLVPRQWRVAGAQPGVWRLSSEAFQNSSDKYRGCSVLIAKLAAEAGISIEKIVASRNMLGAISVTVGQIRGRGLKVGFDPLEDDPFHGQIWEKITRGTANTLLSSAAWSVPIADTVITDRTT